MKLAVFLLIVAFHVSATGVSQITLSERNAPLEKVFSAIERQSGYVFFYDYAWLDGAKKVTFQVKNVSLTEALNECFKDQPLTYSIIGKTIVVKQTIAVGKMRDVGIVIPTMPPPRVITGAITDKEGKPLVGVSVTVKGTTIGTSSNTEGRYSVEVPEDGTLIFSYVGFVTKEVHVNNRSEIDVEMEENVSALDQIVVVGYGTQKKSDLTGSISQIKPEEITAVSTNNVANSLQGRMAGVAISTDDQPGNPPQIRIRGSRSISASNNPLVVVDGFPLVDGDLGDINPDDIASMEVLKDASATAIYGSRGANGVIMVTTKSGSANQNNINVNAYWGFRSPARKVKLMSRDEFIDFINAGYENQTGKPVFTDVKPAPDVNTNWQDAVFSNNSYDRNINLSFDGGDKNTRYMLSGGYLDQDGLTPNTGVKKINFRLNLDHKFYDWFRVGAHLQANKSVANSGIQDLIPQYGIARPNLTEQVLTDPFNPEGPTIVNIFRFGWPIFPVKNPDGTYFYGKEDPDFGGYMETYWNPVANTDVYTNTQTSQILFGNVFAELEFLKHFTFRSTLNADLSSNKLYYYGKLWKYGSTNEAQQTYDQGNTLLSENMLTYKNNWRQHNLVVNGVYSYQETQFGGIGVAGTGLPTDLTGAYNLALIGNLNPPTSDMLSSKLISWTGRANYSYSDRYLLTVTGRYDGSSRFGKNNKWGFFPSVGLGWRINNESFLKNVSTISNLKLRGSYGITGNQEIGDYRSLASLTQVNYIYNNNLLMGFEEGLGNPDLQWEKTSQLDIGLDLGLLHERIGLTVDYFKMITKDLLFDVPIPTTSGYRSSLQNVGETENKGLEVALNLRPIEAKDFTWDVSGNLTTYKNRVKSLYGNVDKIRVAEKQGIVRYLEVGQPVNGIWARKSEGIIKDDAEADKIRSVQPLAQAGGVKYADVNGDGTINEDDYVLIGTTDPDFYYGVSTTFRYKNLSLYVAGQGATGIADPNISYLIMGEYQIDNRIYLPSKYAYDRMWREDNPNGTFPRPGAKDGFPTDVSNGNRNYFIIKNIQLSYDLIGLFKKNDVFKDFTAYVNLQNYMNFANFRGYNPENGNVDFPLAKIFMIGLKVKF